MTDAVLYARVSSKEQREMGFSIEAQVRLLREYADQNDITIIREFIEVETAKCTGRPLFDEMLMFIRKTGSCHAILVEKTDRLYRNFSDMLTLDEMDIDIHFANNNTPSRLCEGRSVFNVVVEVNPTSINTFFARSYLLHSLRASSSIYC